MGRNKVSLTKIVVWTILVEMTFWQYRGHSLLYTPPPLSPSFARRAFVREEGVHILKPPCGRNSIRPPLLCAPSNHRRVCSGVGWGEFNVAPFPNKEGSP